LVGHDDAYIDIAGGRYDWIGRMVRAAVVHPRHGITSLTDKIDRVATHPFWGLLVLLVALAAMFGLTYAIGSPATYAACCGLPHRCANASRSITGMP